MIFFNAEAIVVKERTNVKKIMRISLIWVFNIDLLDVDVLKGTELPPPTPPPPHTHTSI